MQEKATIEGGKQRAVEIGIDSLRVSAYTIPTDYPESDGTIAWDSTTLVLVELGGGGKMGIGYTYADASVAGLIDRNLRAVVIGTGALDIPRLNSALMAALRNNGSSGLSAMAVSAIDIAAWDLKAKIFDLSLVKLLGKVRDDVPLYGSGGFTSYPPEKLRSQLGGWAEEDFGKVKMKIGREPEKDISRVEVAREAIGAATELFVDANGAYQISEAISLGSAFASYGVTWFEEPVPSWDMDGLCRIRDRVPGGMRVAAGEYGSNLPYFENMLRQGAVDVLQADATRCGGITGFLKAGHLAEAYRIPFSAHCAPAIHLQAAMSLPAFFIAEYFYDHARIEHLLFDGISEPVKGVLYADAGRPGLGFSFKAQDARKYAV